MFSKICPMRGNFKSLWFVSRYTDFIRTFGTHYFTSAKMGPFIQHVYRTSRPYMDRFGKEQLKEDAKKSFLTWVRTHANYSRSSMDSDSAFDVASPSDAFNKYTLSQVHFTVGVIAYICRCKSFVGKIGY